MIRRLFLLLQTQKDNFSVQVDTFTVQEDTCTVQEDTCTPQVSPCVFFILVDFIIFSVEKEVFKDERGKMTTPLYIAPFWLMAVS